MGFPPTWSCLHLPQKHSTSTGKDERKRALCNFLKFFSHLSLHHSVFISSYLLLETKLDMRCRIPSLERSSPRKGETQEPEPGHWPSVLTSLTLREQRRVQGVDGLGNGPASASPQEPLGLGEPCQTNSKSTENQAGHTHSKHFSKFKSDRRSVIKQEDCEVHQNSHFFFSFKYEEIAKEQLKHYHTHIPTHIHTRTQLMKIF